MFTPALTSLFNEESKEGKHGLFHFRAKLNQMKERTRVFQEMISVPRYSIKGTTGGSEQGSRLLLKVDIYK